MIRKSNKVSVRFTTSRLDLKERLAINSLSLCSSKRDK